MPVLFHSTAAWIHFARLSCVLNGLLLVQIYQLPDGRITRLLDLYPIRQLGIISYAAYLFHPVIDLSEVANYLGYQLDARRSLTMLADLVATIVLALASWRILERPVRTWLIARSEQRHRSQADIVNEDRCVLKPHETGDEPSSLTFDSKPKT